MFSSMSGTQVQKSESGPVLHARGVNGQVAFDGAVVTITREGFAARNAHGPDGCTIPVGAIAGVAFRDANPFVNGLLVFKVEGDASKSVGDFNHPNSVLFRRKDRAAFGVLVAAVEAARV